MELKQRFLTVIRQSFFREMDDARETVLHCLDQLSTEQVWLRPSPNMNSIGNLVLHMCGNVRQWVVSGLGGHPDKRDRDSEFSEEGPIKKQELCERVSETLQEARRELEEADLDRLSDKIKVQGYDVSGMEAIVHSLSHFRGHTQEIIHMTRVQLGDAYRFLLVVETPDEKE